MAELDEEVQDGGRIAHESDLDILGVDIARDSDIETIVVVGKDMSGRQNEFVSDMVSMDPRAIVVNEFVSAVSLPSEPQHSAIVQAW
ncbi:hypothetical protein CEK25_003364 [Fusarium fujikuroi]|nr:hypothetical protein CEK25_003364 [Fusarium fujikuroi]